MGDLIAALLFLQSYSSWSLTIENLTINLNSPDSSTAGVMAGINLGSITPSIKTFPFLNL